MKRLYINQREKEEKDSIRTDSELGNEDLVISEYESRKKNYAIVESKLDLSRNSVAKVRDNYLKHSISRRNKNILQNKKNMERKSYNRMLEDKILPAIDLLGGSMELELTKSTKRNSKIRPPIRQHHHSTAGENKKKRKNEKEEEINRCFSTNQRRGKYIAKANRHLINQKLLFFVGQSVDQDFERIKKKESIINNDYNYAKYGLKQNSEKSSGCIHKLDTSARVLAQSKKYKERYKLNISEGVSPGEYVPAPSKENENIYEVQDDKQIMDKLYEYIKKLEGIKLQNLSQIEKCEMKESRSRLLQKIRNGSLKLELTPKTPRPMMMIEKSSRRNLNKSCNPYKDLDSSMRGQGISVDSSPVPQSIARLNKELASLSTIMKMPQSFPVSLGGSLINSKVPSIKQISPQTEVEELIKPRAATRNAILVLEEPKNPPNKLETDREEENIIEDVEPIIEIKKRTPIWKRKHPPKHEKILNQGINTNKFLSRSTCESPDQHIQFYYDRKYVNKQQRLKDAFMSNARDAYKQYRPNDEQERDINVKLPCWKKFHKSVDETAMKIKKNRKNSYKDKDKDNSLDERNHSDIAKIGMFESEFKILVNKENIYNELPPKPQQITINLNPKEPITPKIEKSRLTYPDDQIYYSPPINYKTSKSPKPQKSPPQKLTKQEELDLITTCMQETPEDQTILDYFHKCKRELRGVHNKNQYDKLFNSSKRILNRLSHLSKDIQYFLDSKKVSKGDIRDEFLIHPNIYNNNNSKIIEKSDVGCEADLSENNIEDDSKRDDKHQNERDFVRNLVPFTEMEKKGRKLQSLKINKDSRVKSEKEKTLLKGAWRLCHLQNKKRFRSLIKGKKAF